MPERFRILHLAACDTGGPGHAALRIHNGLFALDQDSSLLVKKQTHKSSGIYQTDIDLPSDLKETSCAFDIFQHWYLDHNRTSASNRTFTLGEHGLDMENHP